MELAKRLRAIVREPGGVVEGAAAAAGFNLDYTRRLLGKAEVVVRPRTTAEVAACVAELRAAGRTIVPQGGNTGLVGGATPLARSDVVLSLERLRRIQRIDPLLRRVRAEAGCVHDNLCTALEAHQLTLPVDLGSRGTAQIGGIVATNAGGSRLVRYGPLREHVVGATAVLADGRVMELGERHPLLGLLVGSEGTLAIITEVEVKCVPAFPESSTALVAVRSWGDVLALLGLAKAHIGEALLAIEFFDDASRELVVSELGVRDPFAARHPFYVLLEAAGARPEHDTDKIQAFLEAAGERLADGVLTTSAGRARSLWELREKIPPAVRRAGHHLKFDVSVPVQHFPEVGEELRAALAALPREHLASAAHTSAGGAVFAPRAAHVCLFGHIGDGNLHINVVLGAPGKRAVWEAVEGTVGAFVERHGGSISAEHGIGYLKTQGVAAMRSASEVAAMRAVKHVFDPDGVLNPLKVLPVAGHPVLDGKIFEG